MTSSALPGVPMVAVPPLFPAAMNKVTPALTISLAILFTDSSSEDVHSIAPVRAPRLILAALMLNSCLFSTVHSIPAMTAAKDPLPPPSSTLTPTRFAFGATPMC